MHCIRYARDEDKEAILNLYQSLIGTPGCTWSEDYPSMEDVQYDIENQSLYCMYDEEGAILAAAAAGKDEELGHLTWDRLMKNPCILSRVGVNKSMHNKGLGYALLQYVIPDVKKRGFDGIRMLVGKTNHAAFALYEKLGFHRCGEASLYDQEWYCYEKVLRD